MNQRTIQIPTKTGCKNSNSNSNSNNKNSNSSSVSPMDGSSSLFARGRAGAVDVGSAVNSNSNSGGNIFSTMTTVPTKGGGGAAGQHQKHQQHQQQYQQQYQQQQQNQQQQQQQQRQEFLRRYSSNSNCSLDVAATIFSSIQSLEAAGGSLASLGALGSNGAHGANVGINVGGGSGGQHPHHPHHHHHPMMGSSGGLGGRNTNLSSGSLNALAFAGGGAMRGGGGAGGNMNLASFRGIGGGGSMTMNGMMMGGGGGAHNTSHPFGGINAMANSMGMMYGRHSNSLSRISSHNSLQPHFEEMMAAGLLGGEVGEASSSSGNNNATSANANANANNTKNRSRSNINTNNNNPTSSPMTGGSLPSYLPQYSRGFLEAQQAQVLARQRQLEAEERLFQQQTQLHHEQIRREHEQHQKQHHALFSPNSLANHRFNGLNHQLNASSLPASFLGGAGGIGGIGAAAGGGGGGGGYIPTSSSHSRRNSRNILEEFSPEELLHEVISRRNSRTFLDEMSRSSSRNDLTDFLSGGGGGGGGGCYNRQNSLDTHNSLTALLANATNLEREVGDDLGGGARAAKEGVLGETMTVPLRDNSNSRGNTGISSIPRVIVSTKRDDGPSTATNKAATTTATATDTTPAPAGDDAVETGSEDATAATVVTATSVMTATDPMLTTKKRSNSTSSLDALLSVFGDELAELDRERSAANQKQLDDDDKSTTSSLGFLSNVMISAAAAEEEALAAEKKERDKECYGDDNDDDGGLVPSKSAAEDLDSDGESRTFGSRRESYSSASPPSGTAAQEGESGTTTMIAAADNNITKATAQQNYVDVMLEASRRLPTNNTSTLNSYANSSAIAQTRDDYANQIQTSNALMASLQSAVGMRYNMHGHGLTAGNGGVMPNIVSPLERGLYGSMPPHNGKLTEEMFARLLQARNFQMMHGDVPQEILPVLQPPLAMPLNHKASVIRQESPAPPEKPPVEEFLEKYGESGKKSQTSMLQAIADTEISLAKIHAWDRSQGLRKCHSRTVVKTRRTRAKIKAFLMGLEPPKEPVKNRKKKKAVDGTVEGSEGPQAKKKKGPAAKKLNLLAAELDQ